jgi:16S rRNA (uracil1498-N3)-methyltransferase
MRRFFISPENIVDGRALLDKEDAHHLHTVLRLRPGDTIVVSDGEGCSYAGRIAVMDGGEVSIELLHAIEELRDSSLAIAVAQGFLKEKKMDELIPPLSELGVTRWIPFMARRSVPTPDPHRLSARHTRWQKIAREALKQCRRDRSMVMDPAVPFETALELAQPYTLKVIFWENATVGLDDGLHSVEPDSVFIMLGPEGGFTVDEVERARLADFQVVSLGPRILKAETATIVAATLVQYLWGDLGGKEPQTPSVPSPE